MKTRIFSKVLVVATLVVACLSPLHAAALGTTSFSVSGNSATTGSATSVTINGNGSDLTNVTVRLSYDAAKLSCSGFSGGTGFTNTISQSCANGTAVITRSINGGAATVSGGFSVSTLNFTAISTGSANVSVTSADVPKNGVNDWNGVASGAAITISTPPVVQPPANNGGSGTGSGSTGGTGTPSTGGSTTPPTTGTGGTTTPTTPPAGTVEGTSTKTYTVTIKVVDNRGNEVKNASVTLDGKTAQTDKSGKVSFAAVKAGSYTVQARANNLSVSAKITLNTKNKTTQNFMVQLPSPKRTHWAVTSSGLVALIFATGFMVRRNKTTVTKPTEKEEKAAKSAGQQIVAKKTTKPAAKKKTATKSKTASSRKTVKPAAKKAATKSKIAKK
jgi:hypothetical protein